jgi:hypothetical protein
MIRPGRTSLVSSILFVILPLVRQLRLVGARSGKPFFAATRSAMNGANFESGSVSQSNLVLSVIRESRRVRRNGDRLLIIMRLVIWFSIFGEGKS